ncbi:uncharacterized protein DNG_09612 [Cephalotrichum gorgonifer]|uniref:NWD NACHT-NTPase N-terminal domain-containing protein n=1 Tax=Cephalotrichum gorgonifer TaxID=2041049 RepID=A0AAE8N7W3_9PEZI|nr:uncharacterized protein DNG_09612 [Cephalotrichum gorgonifer]
MDWRFLKSWKRRKGSPRPTQPTGKNANSPKPPVSNPATTASTAPSGSRISIDDVGSRGPVRPSAIVPQPRAATPPPSANENDGSAAKTELWIRAYDAICEDDPELVSAYKAVLSKKLRHEAACDDVSDNAQRQMEHLVQEGLRRTEKAAAKMDKIHKGIRFMSSVKELISTATKHTPEAAAAWAGICLLLGLLETTQAETTAIQDEIKRNIEGLYKKLLSHQMKSICSFYRGFITTIAYDMVKLDDWADILQSVKDTEAAVQRDIDTFHDLEVRTLLNNISKQATDQKAQLQDICRAIQETDQKQEARHQDKQTKKYLTDLRLTDLHDDMKRIADTKGGLFRGASDWILSSDNFRQ